MKDKKYYVDRRKQILDMIVKLPETKKFYKTEAEYKAMYKRLLELESYYSVKVYDESSDEN